MLFVVGEYMNPVTDLELSDLANYIPPNAQERIALILGMGGEVVPNLKGEHRDNMHGISLGILKKWRNAHHQPGNRVVSFIIFSLSYTLSEAIGSLSRRRNSSGGSVLIRRLTEV